MHVSAEELEGQNGKLPGDLQRGVKRLVGAAVLIAAV
jgi:hypothetical protein